MVVVGADDLQKFNPKNRKETVDVLRHEFGHLVVAKSQGFTTGEVKLQPTRAGAIIEIVPSFKTKEDVEDFLEKRLRVLYAGALAQSLNRGKVNTVVANKYLAETATDDYSKAREIARTLAGIKYHDATSYDDFEQKLGKMNERFYKDAMKLVEKNAELIVDLSVFGYQKIEEAQRKNWSADSFEITQAEIDTFIQNHVPKATTSGKKK